MQFLCDQDREDFEQERRINEWLSKTQPDRPEILEQQYTNSKGNPRNTLIRAKFSLDQTVSRNDPVGSTFADLVAGFDGRSLDDGDADYHFGEYFEGTVFETLTALGLMEDEIECLKKMWLRSEMLSELRSPISTIDLEWESL